METSTKWSGVTGAKLLLQPWLRILLCFLLFYCLLHAHLCSSADSLSSGQSLTGNQTIISSGGIFELGYFSLGNRSRYYIGIWYKKVPVDNLLWVANRDSPLPDSKAEFKISKDGNLVIQAQSRSLVWSTNLTAKSSSRAAVLLDNGNLVLRDHGSSSNSVVWDSFSYPTNSWVPGQRLGLNKATKYNQVLTSWKNLQDPSSGLYSLKIDPNGTAQILLLWKRTQQYWTTGLWDGHIFGKVPEMRGSPINFPFTSNENVSYFTYIVKVENAIYFRYVVDYTGQVKLFIWAKGRVQWLNFWVGPAEDQICSVYGLCGAFGVCNRENLNHCQCLSGFEPASFTDWELNDWSGGCRRKKKLGCGSDQFALQTGMRLASNVSVATVAESAEGCRSACLKACSCTAYSYQHSKCSLWKGDLFNLQLLSDGSGDDIYIRLAELETLNNETTKKQQPTALINRGAIGGGGRKHWRVTISLTVTLAVMLSAATGAYIFWRCKTKIIGEGEESRGQELPMFDLGDIMAATNKFSESNKLGQGGFGSVYKGNLAGEQVAVKRLSLESAQGLEEFMNEVKLIAKLQHRNLVDLLGCCVEGEEKILVYEFMPNKSLDKFLFDQTLDPPLNWEKRFEIVMGIARGLQYLHQESRLKVIHRDLKTSNILLDGEMNPKISDFGLARILGGDQTQASTVRVVGTYGYMPPEYALEGRYSAKSDVFSFGVIALEIVSGKKMTSFQDAEDSMNLLGHAWKLWNEGKGLDLLDPLLGKRCQLYQVMRCINVGLLCVQANATDRPKMSSIVLMLSSSFSATLPVPKQPAFSYKDRHRELGSCPMGSEPSTTPISMVEAR